MKAPSPTESTQDCNSRQVQLEWPIVEPNRNGNAAPPPSKGHKAMPRSPPHPFPRRATNRVKSSNLSKATMAPILWQRGEKPLSMKSSVLCRAKSGLEMLTGTDILGGGKRKEGGKPQREQATHSWT